MEQEETAFLDKVECTSLVIVGAHIFFLPYLNIAVIFPQLFFRATIAERNEGLTKSRDFSLRSCPFLPSLSFLSILSRPNAVDRAARSFTISGSLAARVVRPPPPPVLVFKRPRAKDYLILLYSLTKLRGTTSVPSPRF